MLYWAAAFFIISLIAALFGFSGIAVASVGIAKNIFFVYLVLFLISLVLALFNRKPPAV